MVNKAEVGSDSPSKTIIKQTVRIVRNMYLLCAVVFVSHGLYKTLRKVQEQNVNVSTEIKLVSKIKFPSVTFCHKYKHGGKDAMLAYSNQLLGKWKESGKNNSYHVISYIIITNYKKFLDCTLHHILSM